MNVRIIRRALVGAAIAGSLTLTACGNDDMPSMSGMGSSASAPPSPTAAGSTSTEHNDADLMFVRGMIPHHQQAVEMSDMLLKKSGVSPETTALAQQIQAAQQPEIATMQGWLKTWGQPMDDDMDGMDQGGMDDGMAGVDEMKNFEVTDGTDAEELYLKMMTMHHQGAIKMAQKETSDGKNPDAVALAKTIIETQQGEINTMRQLLAKL